MKAGAVRRAVMAFPCRRTRPLAMLADDPPAPPGRYHNL
jgi:hypothetical protein